MIGYYFAEESRTLRYGDGRKIEVGKMHTVKGKPSLCGYGLHASKEPFDALKYAPGPILYRVELSRNLVHYDYKSVGQHRRYLAEIDATHLLRSFARKQALSVIHLWDAPAVVREYLETGNDALRVTALAAAWVAAWSAPLRPRLRRDAAWDAARAAARAAARRMFNEMVYAAFAEQEKV